MEEEQLDLVVIGAGVCGLTAASTHLTLHPASHIAIIDAAPYVGGVWARHRLYPGLRTNNLLGMYELPDFPLKEVVAGQGLKVKEGEHVPGEIMGAYLEEYAEVRGLREKGRCRLEWRVEWVREIESGIGGWRIGCNVKTKSDGGEGEKRVLRASKLVVATGLTSTPFVPRLKGSESFDRSLFHTVDFKKNAATLNPAKTKRIALLGGGKSAWDVAHEYASTGIPVDWIIRASGAGPRWMAPAFVTPLKRQLEKLVSTRVATWLSPCIFDSDGYAGIRWFLHQTWLGVMIVKVFFWILGTDTVALMGFDKHPETKKLKPWHSALFAGNELGIKNYGEDPLEYVRNGIIKVHIADITHLSAGCVHLSTSEALETDALICATGWSPIPAIKFLPEGLDVKLGLPHIATKDEVEKDASIIASADREIERRFPLLAAHHTTLPSSYSEKWEGYALYRFIVPPSYYSKRTIAFAGALLNLRTAVCAELQALWIAAYFSDRLNPIPSPSPPQFDAIRYNAVLYARFEKYRFPEKEKAVPDLVLDAVPYFDLLEGDLGLQRWRKGGVGEWVAPYGVTEWNGVVEEWKKRVRWREGEQSKGFGKLMN
ncbi:flavin-binding monooxygenase-like protein [Patellaria atrata CBS 101060]|uniref:Flavin-binding monooxygenase-like protein n=1 Tax=Patellaria atrata CBS 101060 TaxID=1346257 RepID=A0A9P4S805_9PEZI|nr:flavin-binding monooxygenase-like protein [Patellaria atrata CBS 101060]